MNNLALQFRKLRRLEKAESLLRRALAIDEKARGETHPIIPHRLNNLCTVLIMQGKLDEAKPLLARAWQIKQGNHDITSARVLFVRLAIAFFESRPAGCFIGQLNALLSGDLLEAKANVAQVWKHRRFPRKPSCQAGPGNNRLPRCSYPCSE